MNKLFLTAWLVLSLTVLLSLSGCISTTSGEPAAATPTSPPAESLETQAPLPAPAQEMVLDAERQAGFEINLPDPSLLEDYALENATVDEATKSVCLQYRHAAPSGDSVLFIAQGPAELTPELELIPDLPEYLASQQAVEIGGAENSLDVAGWRRSAWACTEAAEGEATPYSYAVAPRLTWEAGGRIFDLYSTSGGCSTPGGMTMLGLLRIAESLTGKSTHAADELDADCLLSVSDAEKLAGFDVKQPAYLPDAVSFYYATVDKSPDSGVTLFFLHNEHPESGRFFQIIQSKEALPFILTSCANAEGIGCEVINTGETPVIYHTSGPNEQLDWQEDGYFFSLFRSAGEPGVVYKDELLKVLASLK